MKSLVLVPRVGLKDEIDRQIKSEERRIKRSDAKARTELVERTQKFAARESLIRSKYLPLIVEHWEKNRFAHFRRHLSVWSHPLTYGSGIFSFWVKMDTRQMMALKELSPGWLSDLLEIARFDQKKNEPSSILNVRIEDLPAPSPLSRDWLNCLILQRAALLQVDEGTEEVLITENFAQLLWGDDYRVGRNVYPVLPR